MKVPKWCAWMVQVAIGLVIFAGCAHRTPDEGPAAQSLSPHERMVVVISIDGLPDYVLDDPTLPAPTLRRLQAEGAFARDGMTIINPTMTWPNHATLATGASAAQHGVLFNGRLLRPGKRLPVKVAPRSRFELMRAPTLYDLAFEKRMTTAQVGWIPPQVGGTFTWAFPENPKPEGGLERELVAAGIVAGDDLRRFPDLGVTYRDEIWTRVAKYLIWRHRPNLLYLHLLNLDSSHHHYGPRTLAGASAIALADLRVRDIWDALYASGLADRTTLFVVSDHGFKQVKRQIRPNAALRIAGLLQAQGRNVLECDAWVIPQGGTAMVYVTDPDRREEIIPRLKETLAKLEGVDQVIEPGAYAALGLPHPSDNDQMGDLVLAAKAGYAFSIEVEGDPVVPVPSWAYVGTHGYLADDPDMNAIFIAWGHGIRAGAPLGKIRNVDLAPTAGAILGLPVPHSTGRVLGEILK